jgi:hypothetical protein
MVMRPVFVAAALSAVVFAGAARRPAGAQATAPAGVTSAPRAPWYAPVASLIAPGAGQAILGQSRALGYVAVELYALLEYRAQHTEAVRGRRRYHALARDVARAFFSVVRPPGPFEYYEAMEKYVESGAFDRVPGGDVDPEVDETTFNGFVWRLARETFWTDPDVPPPSDSPAFVSAVSMYLQRAVRPDFAWSWRNAALEHDLFRRSIRRSNDGFRRAREQLGVLLANHLLSMADAFATVRVRAPEGRMQAPWRVELIIPLSHRD